MQRTPESTPTIPQRPAGRRAATRAAALAVLVAAALPAMPAHAGEFEASVGMGNLTTPTYGGRSRSWDWMAGYRFHDRDFGVQVIGLRQTQPYHQPVVVGGPALYDFDNAIGLQGVAYWQLTYAWDLYVSGGVAQESFTSGTPGSTTQSKTDSLIGLGVRWEVVPHAALAFEVLHLNSAGVTAPQLRAEFSF